MNITKSNFCRVQNIGTRTRQKKMRFWSVANRRKECNGKEKMLLTAHSSIQCRFTWRIQREFRWFNSIYKTSLLTVHAKQKSSLVGRLFACSQRMAKSEFEHVNLFEANFTVSSNIENSFEKDTHQFQTFLQNEHFSLFRRFVSLFVYSILNSINY